MWLPVCVKVVLVVCGRSIWRNMDEKVVEVVVVWVRVGCGYVVGEEADRENIEEEGAVSVPLICLAQPRTIAFRFFSRLEQIRKDQR